MSGDDDGRQAGTSGAGEKPAADPADKAKIDADAIDFHGAAIIDEDGHEIPITEDMIKDACKKLDPTAVEEAGENES